MCWTNDELFEALKPYKQECETANLAAATIKSNVNYARMFVRWRINDFHTHGGYGAARESRSVCAEIPDLEEDLRAYEEYLRSAGRTPNAVRTYLSPAGQFVDSLDGRFIPGASRNSRSGQVRASSQRSATDAGPFRSTSRPPPRLPSDDEVLAKRKIYAAAEPRDLAYKVARHLIERAQLDDSPFSTGDGVAVLLMSWNAGFYRFRPGPVRTLAVDLDRLIASHDREFEEFRTRSIASYDEDVERAAVRRIYRDFLAILWPVGTAKAMHVLAPNFFPIWDTAIANAFRLRLSPPERSVDSYLDLMRIARTFATKSRLSDPLKALDEWAYVSYTLRQ